VAVNDLGPVETNAHLLRYDSVHGRFPHEVKVEGDTISTGKQKFKVTAVKDPSQLPHKEMGVDIVLECTGIFTSQGEGLGPPHRRRQEGDRLGPRPTAPTRPWSTASTTTS
jgi:glyceraldehyde-3-phosphate dehydrogenase/erythrose-4-phosphate dehydrogenase